MTTMMNKNINKDYELSDLLHNEFSLNNNIKNYRSICPICELDGYKKKSLSIKNDLSIAKCFKCDTIFFNKFDPLKNEFSSVIKKNKKINYSISKLSNLNDYLSLSGLTTIGKNYLLNRNKYLNLESNKYKLKSTDNYIIIPFFINNELIYYQKRFINNSGLKHFKPIINNQPFYHINNNSNKLIISEGCFDAIACDIMYKFEYDCIALCGKSMSHYQFWLLNKIKMYDEILIYLDETSLSLNLYNNIKNKFTIQPNFDIIESLGEDPEEKLNNNNKGKL